MSQPIWKAIAQLGDLNPLDHGGQWVLHDKTGVYTDEIEVLEVPEDDKLPRTILRFNIDKCTFTDGILSDNPFHPEHPAWFAKRIDGVASFVDSSPEEMIESLCSDDPVTRARAYLSMAMYFGFIEFDQYPLKLSKAECEDRYKDEMYQCSGWEMPSPSAPEDPCHDALAAK